MTIVAQFRLAAGSLPGSETVPMPSPLKPYALQISLQAVLVVHRCILGAVAKGAICSGRHHGGQVAPELEGEGPPDCARNAFQRSKTSSMLACPAGHM